MRVLLTGANGQLGTDFQSRARGLEIVPLDLPSLDIRNFTDVRQAFRQTAPAVVVHAAAWTDVDGAESQPEEVFAVNALGSRNVALAAEETGAWLITISSDYVFAGDRPEPYHEYDRPGPRTVYGRSKLAGEEAVAAFCRRHTILRTAWLYGRTGINFPARILALAAVKSARGETLRVVDDQRGNPTTTFVLAELIQRLIADPVPGVVHGTCEGVVSWYGFASEILARANVNCRIEPCTTAEFPRPASRPANSALDKMVLRQAGRPPLPHWSGALQEWLEVTGNVRP